MMQETVDEVPSAHLPPVTLQRLTEVPPVPAFAPPPAPQAKSGEVPPVPAFDPPPAPQAESGLKETAPPPGLEQQLDDNEVSVEMKELLDNVCLELTRIADAFASSQFMTKSEDFECHYFTSMLPPGLYDNSGAKCIIDDCQDEIGLQIKSQLDGNDSSDESTRNCSSKSSNPDQSSNSEDIDSPVESLASDDEDDDECNDLVPELPNLSAKGLNAKKSDLRPIAKTTRGTTRIVFGDQGSELAAQVAGAHAAASKWKSTSTAHAAYWNPYMDNTPPAIAAYYDPYYGYMAW